MKQATDTRHGPDLGPNFWQDAIYSRRLLPEGLDLVTTTFSERQAA